MTQDQDPATSAPESEQDAPAAPADGAMTTPADGEMPSAGNETTRGPGQPAARSASLLGLAVVLALSLALIASAATGFLWWQYRQFYVALSAEDASLERALEDVRASLRRLADADAELGNAQADAAGRIEALADEVDPLAPGIAALDQRIDTLQGGSIDARARWLRAEAEYYLVTANTELEVAGHWEAAIEALGLADELLRQLADPGLSAVRAAIAEELQTLRAVELPDVEGLSFSLAGLAERAPELPLRAESPTRFGSEEPTLDEVEPGLGRLWLGLKQAVLGIVRIERRDTPVQVVLSEAERRVLRGQFALELELARVALQRGQPEAFTASLDAATTLLERDFDASAQSVAGAIDLLGAMRRLDIAPAAPDISQSLRLLRAAPGND